MNQSVADSFVYRVRRELYRGSLHLGETVYAPCEVVPPHSHSQPVVILFLEGPATHSVRAREWHVLPGHVAYIPAGLSHSLRFGAGVSRAFSVELDPDRCKRGLPDYCFHTSAPHFLRAMLLGYRALVEKGCPNGDRLQATLVSSVRRVDRQRSRLAECGAARAWLARALELVSDGATNAVRVGSIASEVGKHPSHLSRRFREVFGESLASMRDRVRVEAASRALLSDACSISTIAADLGFCDHAHLTRSFRRSMRMTPRDYRRAIGETRLPNELRKNLDSTGAFTFRAAEAAEIRMGCSA